MFTILFGLHCELLFFNDWHFGSVHSLDEDFRVHLYRVLEISTHTHTHMHIEFFLGPKFCLLLYGQNPIQMLLGLHNCKIEAEVYLSVY